MKEPFLETRRLALHQLDVGFAQLVLSYYRKNHQHFANSMPLITREMLTLAFQERLLEQQERLIETQQMLKLYLFEKSDTNLSNIVGDLTFNNIIWGGFRSCFLGYKLDKEAVKNGFMLEAVKASIDFMFRQMELHRVEANIRPENKDSIALVQKLGFQKEGFSPKYLKINGTWQDHLRFALLNDLIEV